MILSFFAITIAAFASDTCLDTSKASAEYKAIEGCRADRAAAVGGKMEKTARLAGGQEGFCEVGSETGLGKTKLSKEFCEDPGGYVCNLTGGTGNVLDSKCRLLIFDKKKNKTPEIIEAQCAVSTATRNFIAGKRSKCPSDRTGRMCESWIRAKFADELDRLNVKTVYTADRLKIFNVAFDRVKTRYLKLLKSSDKIPKDLKKLLAQQIEDTIPFATKPGDLDGSYGGCEVMDDDGGSVAIYYAGAKDDKGRHKVHICAGVMANLENIDPYNLMLIIGHELSHAIDPCNLERLGTRSEDVEKAYPKLRSCLRGGDCKDAALKCNTENGVEGHCSNHAADASFADASKRPDFYKECLEKAKARPDCPWGTEEPQPDDGQDYRRSGEQLDQMREGFSDFMGAEVVGSLLEEDVGAGKIDLSERRDSLIGLASLHSRLHGVCVDKSLDDHPPGRARTNRMVMGSKTYRKAIGCGSKQVPKGGTTCKGF